MGGYCGKRSSVRTNIIKAYGKMTLPKYVAGYYSTTNTANNVVPEMFFGFYNSTGNLGFDLGILHVGGNQWKAFYGGYGEWDDSSIFNIEVGSIIYANAWVELTARGWCAKLNLSRQGYDNTDIIQFVHYIKNTSVANQCNKGFRINREVSIAANDGALRTYETTGSYIYDAMFSDCTLIERTGAYCRWTDKESINIKQVQPWQGGRFKCKYKNAPGKRNAIELRKDEGNVNTKFISADCRNVKDSTGTIYAKDTISIHFK